MCPTNWGPGCREAGHWSRQASRRLASARCLPCWPDSQAGCAFLPRHPSSQAVGECPRQQRQQGARIQHLVAEVTPGMGWTTPRDCGPASAVRCSTPPNPGPSTPLPSREGGLEVTGVWLPVPLTLLRKDWAGPGQWVTVGPPEAEASPSKARHQPEAHTWS